MNIIKKTSIVHTGYLKNRNIRFIVLHYTAGTQSETGTARNVAAMFANPNNRAASADFIVDGGEIVQYNPDISNRYTYAVGGGKYGVRYTPLSGMYYGQCKNNNSISIEMCSTKANRKSLQATDTDWSISVAVVDRAVELTKYLMQKYNIPLERVIMHHQVTGKLCPQPWCLNSARLGEWEKFKVRLSGGTTISETEAPDMTETQTRKIAEEVALKAILKLKDEAIVYNTVEETPEWGRPTAEKLIGKGLLQGTGAGMGVSFDMLRTLVILDRAGLF